MESPRSSLHIMRRVSLEISDSWYEMRKREDMTYHNYCMQFTCIYHNKSYTWMIRRTYYEFQNLVRALSKEFCHLSKKPQLLPSYSYFRLKSPLEQHLKLREILSFYISDYIYSQSNKLTEFIEISANSFKYDHKLKEGYVYKEGSGRNVNKRKYCRFYQVWQGHRKKWLRVTHMGIEYSDNHFTEGPAEVIGFSKNFSIAKGKRLAGSRTAIKIEGTSHSVVFRAKNTQQRDEFENTIREAFERSVFSTHESRYDSSFMIRESNFCKAYVDSHDYFKDVLKALQKAKKYVYITDWWLSPELYLKRPSVLNPETQITEVLGKLADKNIKVYVHLYKEISISLAINSLHTKIALQQRSPNINVMRHPNISIKGGVFLWSHHEKMVVVDGQIAFLGGLDLCYGRYDTSAHSLTDIEEPYQWNDIDYSNVRVADFTNVENWQRESIDRHSVPRMPWHDIAMAVKGAVVCDLETHFMELWNHAVRDFTGSKDTKVIIPLKNGSQSSSFSESQYSNFSVFVRVKEEEKSSSSFRKRTKKMFADPNPLADKFLEELEHSEKCDEAQKSNRISASFEEGPKRFLALPVANASRMSVADVDKFLEEKKNLEIQDTKFTQNYFKDAILKGTQVFIDNVIEQRPSLGSCKCQLLRSAGIWSIGRAQNEYSIHYAYLWQIAEAKRFIYIENQFFISSTAGKPVVNQVAQALVERIRQAHLQRSAFKVIVVVPLLPGFEGSIDDPNASVLRVQMHYQYKTICRGGSSIYESLINLGIDPHSYIKFYGLRNHAVIGGNPVTEMVYVHSKLMIIDDRRVIMGSANINDRSMLGDRDSELAMLIEDSDTITGKMAGADFKVSKFAHNLRMKIFKEHSGEDNEELLRDPLSEEFNSVWETRAKINTMFYKKVFRCYPDDDIKDIEGIYEFLRQTRLDLYELNKGEVIGHIVEYPLQFLEHEELSLKIANKEYFLPDTTFT